MLRAFFEASREGEQPLNLVVRRCRKERVTREEQDERTPSTSDKDYGNTPRGKAIVPPSPLRHNVRGSERERVTDRSRLAKSRCLSKFLCPSKRRFSRRL